MALQVEQQVAPAFQHVAIAFACGNRFRIVLAGLFELRKPTLYQLYFGFELNTALFDQFWRNTIR